MNTTSDNDFGKEKQAQSSTLVKAPYLNTGYAVRVYEGTIQFINETRRPADRDKRFYLRGKVQQFSRKSRYRLLKLFARLQYSKFSHPVFVTLTYHFAYTKATNIHRQHLNSFLVAVRRRFPKMGYIWRLEPQKRGAPHFHLLFFSTQVVNPLTLTHNQSWLNHTWHRIADPESVAHLEHGCKIKVVYDRKHAFYYVSKYCGKVQEGVDDELEGRRWGASRNLPVKYYVDFELHYATWDALRKSVSIGMSELGASGYMRMKLATESGTIEIFQEHEVSMSLVLQALHHCPEEKNRDFVLELINST